MGTLRERLAADVEELYDLPLLSPAVPALLAALNRDDAGLREITEFIRQDPALTVKVLRAANSAFYAGPVPITSVREALLRLGLKTVRRLTMVMSLYSTVPVGGNRLGREDFWLHSLGVAQAAEIIGRRSELGAEDSDLETLFLTGLLHDVGLLILAIRYPKEYDAAVIVAGRDGLAFHAAEMAVYGCDHGELGAILARHWGLPDAIVGPIGAHHQIELADAEHRWASQVIHLADMLCRHSGIEDMNETRPVDADWDAVGISAADRAKVLEEIRLEAERAASVLRTVAS